MSASIPAQPPTPAHLVGRRTLFLALAAFAVANVVHNRFGLDPAIVPAAVLTGLVAWRQRRPFLWGAALFIALPSFLFLQWTAFATPGDTWTFVNHVALLAAGSLAVASVIRSLMPTRALHHPS
jgi:hypothetical protein